MPRRGCCSVKLFNAFRGATTAEMLSAALEDVVSSDACGCCANDRPGAVLHAWVTFARNDQTLLSWVISRAARRRLTEDAWVEMVAMLLHEVAPRGRDSVRAWVSAPIRWHIPTGRRGKMVTGTALHLLTMVPKASAARLCVLVALLAAGADATALDRVSAPTTRASALRLTRV